MLFRLLGGSRFPDSSVQSCDNHFLFLFLELRCAGLETRCRHLGVRDLLRSRQVLLQIVLDSVMHEPDLRPYEQEQDLLARSA